MTMITRSQVEITDSSVRNRDGPELGEIGCQSNRLGEFDVDFWKAHLAGAPALLELPTDRPRPLVLSYAGGRVGLALTAELTAGVRRLGQRHGATLFMTLFSGWSALLSRLSGQSDIVIGTSVANRQRSEIEPLTGSSVNTLALRVRLEQDPSVAELLAQIKVSTLEAYAHQEIHFAQLAEALQLPISLNSNPIFRVMLALDNAPGEPELSLPGSKIDDLAQPHTTAKFDLTLSLRDAGDSIVGFLVYASDLFERSTIERMAEHLRTVLEAMVADDQQHISELNLLSQPEHQQVLSGWNARAASFPSWTLPKLPAEQVGGTPGTDALVDGTRRLSYAELDRAADSLAATLQQRNVELVAARTQADAAAAIARERIAALEAETRQQTESVHELRVQFDAVRDCLAQRNALIERVEAEAASSVAALGNIQHNLEHLGAEEQAHLLVRTDGETGILHLLGRLTMIGRMPDNDVHIDAEFISRHHAVALRAGAKTVIEDLNSTNGTYVNGQRVSRCTLKDGDLVTLGNTEFRFSVNNPPP
jgi:non-ribosomal peptide synthetase component F